MRKAWIVARHEFRVTVRRVWFVVATVVLPLVVLGISGAMMTLAHHAAEESLGEVRQKPLGVVDEWGELDERLPAIRKYPGEKEAGAALRAHEIGAYLVVPSDYLDHGVVKVMTMRRPTLLTSDQPPLPPGVHEWLQENVLRPVSDERRRKRAQDPFRPQPVYLDATGQVSTEDPTEIKLRGVSAYALFMLLFTSIFTSSAYLLQGMAEEKEHRVMEIILSSASPSELMLGKLIGLGAAGLIQMLIWFLLGAASVALLHLTQLRFSPETFLFCFVYFLLGYVLYGSLMLGFGALGTNLRESQQMASIWTLLGASPVMVLIALLEAPQGRLARIFSYIPFTAPTTMMFRYAIDPKGTPWLDIAGSTLVLGVSTYVALRASARLYRAGLLLYGKRPGVREIWRWLVAAR
jgi:ABC-2 type transport system permease protein